MKAKEFTMNVLNGLSTGVVITLIPSALLGQLMKALSSAFPAFTSTATTITAMTNFTMCLLAAVAAFCVGTAFKFNLIQTGSLAAAATLGAGVVTPTTKGFLLSGTGDVINITVTIVIGVLVAQFIGDKLKNYTVLLVPVLVILIAGGLGMITLPYVRQVTTFIGAVIMHLTVLQPILMGALMGLVFAVLIVSPISSVGIATAISLSGIASGSANLGIVAGSFTLAIMGASVNSLGTTLAHFIGTPKIQMANMLEKPKLFIPVMINAAIAGAIGAIFNIKGTPMSAGFGFSGLIGPLAAWNETNQSVGTMIVLIIIFLVMPIVLGFLARQIFINQTKLVSPENLLIKA